MKTRKIDGKKLPHVFQNVTKFGQICEEGLRNLRKSLRSYFSGWLGTWVASMLDLGAEGSGFKSQLSNWVWATFTFVYLF